MYWSIVDKTGSEVRIGECYANCSCESFAVNDYNITRPSQNRTELRILENYRDKADKRIKCTQRMNQTQDNCTLTVVYPGKLSNCSLWTNKVNWTVHAFCLVEKIFSSGGNYNCSWKQRRSSSGQDTAEISGELSLSNFTNGNGSLYFTGNCSLNYSLPETDGQYMYEVTVQPGLPDKVLDAGTVDIESPGDPEINWSAFAMENQTFSCHCRPFSVKPGKPAPLLSWFNFSTTGELTLTNVHRHDNGTQFTCQLTWGHNQHIVKMANYTLQVAYGPDSATISPESEPGMNRTSLICRADDVHPAANFTWTGVVCDARNDTRDESVCYFSKTVENAGKDVTCTAVNVLDTSLAVKATFHDSDLDTNEPMTGIPVAAIAGSVGAAVVVVLVIVIIVVIIIMSKRRKEAADQGQALSPKEDKEADTDFMANNLGAVNYYNAGPYDRNLQSPSGVTKEQDGQNGGEYTVVEDRTAVGSCYEDVYAVVDKGKKHQQTANKNKIASQSASAQNASPMKPGCIQGETTARSSDVYSHVKKSPKQDGPGSPSSERSSQDKKEAGEESVQSKMAKQKRKPAVRSKPMAKSSEAMVAGDAAAHDSNRKPSGRVVREAYENVRMSSELPSLSQPEVTQTAEDDDEYNTLKFEAKQSSIRDDPNSDYSHLDFF